MKKSQSCQEILFSSPWSLILAFGTIKERLHFNDPLPLTTMTRGVRWIVSALVVATDTISFVLGQPFVNRSRGQLRSSLLAGALPILVLLTALDLSLPDPSLPTLVSTPGLDSPRPLLVSDSARTVQGQQCQYDHSCFAYSKSTGVVAHTTQGFLYV